MIQRGGTDLSLADARGYTAMHEACASGNAPIVQQLLSAGAEVDPVTHAGETPLMVPFLLPCITASKIVLKSVAHYCDDAACMFR